MNAFTKPALRCAALALLLNGCAPKASSIAGVCAPFAAGFADALATELEAGGNPDALTELTAWAIAVRTANC